MSLSFRRETQEATFYSPLEDFESVTTEVELREDPLTGRQARIVPESFLTPEEAPDIEPVVGDSEGCFFCPDRVDEVTPKYPDWVGTERGRVGEATSFPNLNPYGAHSNVVALTEDHYRPLQEFTPEIFRDGLQAALEYVHAVVEEEGEDAAYASVNMNFLRPAGSSIVHPHLQALVDDRGTNAHRRQVEAARGYRDEAGEGYWPALVDCEREGDRYVAGDAVEWLAPFAPTHHRHLRGVATGVENAGGGTTGVPAPDGEVVAALAEGITDVLAFYAEKGLNSFNFALWLAPGEPAWTPVLDVVSRSVFDEYYWSDSPYFTVLHDEGVVDIAPETYAKAARSFL